MLKEFTQEEKERLGVPKEFVEAKRKFIEEGYKESQKVLKNRRLGIKYFIFGEHKNKIKTYYLSLVKQNLS